MSTITFLQAVTDTEAVAEYTKQTAENTAFFPWDFTALLVAVFSLFVAGCSLYYAFRTWRSQQQTERNTNRLEEAVQKELLIDMCRHLYRNLVITYTIAEKIRPAFKRYPSEEHLLKMKVNLEDIHDELYYKREESFFQISKLYLNLRNYNTELEIISNHLSDPAIDVKTKERDLKTLLFKCSFLTKEILLFLAISRIEKDQPSNWRQAIHDIRKGKDQELLPLMRYEISEVRNILMEQKQWAERDNISAVSAEEQAEVNPSLQVIAPAYLGSTVYDTLLFTSHASVFLHHFDADVCMELGKNEQDGSKVWLIDFPA